MLSLSFDLSVFLSLPPVLPLCPFSFPSHFPLSCPSCYLPNFPFSHFPFPWPLPLLSQFSLHPAFVCSSFSLSLTNPIPISLSLISSSPYLPHFPFLFHKFPSVSLFPSPFPLPSPLLVFLFSSPLFFKSSSFQGEMGDRFFTYFAQLIVFLCKMIFLSVTQLYPGNIKYKCFLVSTPINQFKILFYLKIQALIKICYLLFISNWSFFWVRKRLMFTFTAFFKRRLIFTSCC